MALNRLLVPTFFGFIRKLDVVAICQHMNFVEKSSVNKYKLKFVFCGFYNHYRICFKNGYFGCPSVKKLIFKKNNAMRHSRKITAGMWKSHIDVSGWLMNIFAAVRGLHVLSKPNFFRRWCNLSFVRCHASTQKVFESWNTAPVYNETGHNSKFHLWTRLKVIKSTTVIRQFLRLIVVK